MYLNEVREQEEKNIPGSEHSECKGPEAERERWEPVVRKQSLVRLGKVCKFHSQ